MASLDLQTVDLDTGALPERRIADPTSANAIHRQLQQEDGPASIQRACIQGMIDGEPPYDDTTLKNQGQADRCNLDFGDAKAIIAAAVSAFLDLPNSVDYLWFCRTEYGAPEDRDEWSHVISEEFHRTCKMWQEFEFNLQYVALGFVTHGVSFAFWDDPFNWQFASAHLGDIKLPRNTNANERSINIATVERDMPVHELFDKIRDEKAATEIGWNVKAVKEALYCASNGAPEDYDWTDVEKYQKQLRENGLYHSFSQGTTVRIVYYWAQEFTGKVSFSIGVKSGKVDEYLFDRPDYFDNIYQALIGFTYGIGSGTYHSIRGLGQAIFPHIQMTNRKLCDIMDMSRLSDAVIIQPEHAKDLVEAPMTYIGPLAVMRPGVKLVPGMLPNKMEQALPLVREIDMRIQNNTGTYKSRATTPQGQARTATEVRAQMVQENVLSQDAMNLFYVPFGRLGQEMYRRMMRDGLRQDEPGGELAWDFRTRCVKRGVPLKALHGVTTVEPVRAVGNGSAAMRQQAFQELFSISSGLDEVGRVNLMRDIIASKLGGYDRVSRYMPANRIARRATVDEEIVGLENTMISQGESPQVVPGQNDVLHAKGHFAALLPLVQAVQDHPDKIEPGPVANVLQVGAVHGLAHVQKFAGDPTRAPVYSQLRAAYENIMHIAEQMQNVIKKQQAQAAQDQQSAQEQQGDPNQPMQLSPELAAMLQEHAAKMKMDAETHHQKMNFRAADFQQKLALRDAATSSEIQKKGINI